MNNSAFEPRSLGNEYMKFSKNMGRLNKKKKNSSEHIEQVNSFCDITSTDTKS